ncbi:cysteine-rich repeat secretory protein 3 isoform X1 [Arachis ipaensis]|uniref:cysteine-rich repeat secretory protein 3 isoform X1 n=1 Tax=Arachis ipaensis TaxID=130454 RepID=UPI000A2B4F74|nr:cysteine-rich repeat secretory protein 3 isoform X1 [Arachis ipaensis]
MGFPRKTLFLLVFMVLFTNHYYSESASDYTTLVYKGCSKDTFTDPNGVYSQALSSLFGSLVAQSTKTKFFKATSGSGQSTMTGIFQCRGDLSTSDCYNCVSRLPVLSDKLCGKTIAARIQLLGCYMLYEVAGFSEQVSGMQMLFKACGATTRSNGGFEVKRDTAFSVMENGVVSAHGFYATSYQGLYVMGQCEGDVGDSDCGECVKNAVQKAEVECGSSTSAQVYLHKCFISYGYYPNGVPRGHSSSSSSASSSSSYSSSSSGFKHKTFHQGTKVHEIFTFLDLNFVTPFTKCHLCNLGLIIWPIDATGRAKYREDSGYNIRRGSRGCILGYLLAIC